MKDSSLDALFVALHLKDFERVSSILSSLDDRLDSLSEKELEKVYRALQEGENHIKREREKTISHLKDLEKLKKFCF